MGNHRYNYQNLYLIQIQNLQRLGDFVKIHGVLLMKRSLNHKYKLLKHNEGRKHIDLHLNRQFIDFHCLVYSQKK